jgi:hypothetical protein
MGALVKMQHRWEDTKNIEMNVKEIRYEDMD